MWKRPLGKQCGTDYYLTELHGLSCNGGNCAKRHCVNPHMFTPRNIKGFFVKLQALAALSKALNPLRRAIGICREC